MVSGTKPAGSALAAVAPNPSNPIQSQYRSRWATTISKLAFSLRMLGRH
jgi:hypothetical protein